MDRPSHMSLRTSHSLSGRALQAGLALLFPFAALWGLGHGLAGKAFHEAGPLIFTPDREAARPKPPAPLLPPPLQRAPVISVVPPEIVIAPEQGGSAPLEMPSHNTGSQPPAAVTADQAAAPIAATHTIPPYPPIAERLGEEGNVTLRLTVLADGSVAKAEILASSGSPALDRAAQGWIVAHWRYRPAVANGQPVATQATAVVQFNLNK